MLQSLRAAWCNFIHRREQRRTFRDHTRSYVRNLARFNNDPTWLLTDLQGNICRHRTRAVVIRK